MVIVSNWIRYDLVDWVSKDRSQPYSVIPPFDTEAREGESEVDFAL